MRTKFKILNGFKYHEHFKYTGGVSDTGDARTAASGVETFAYRVLLRKIMLIPTTFFVF